MAQRAGRDDGRGTSVTHPRAGRPDPRCHRLRRSVRPLLRGDPARRGIERVHDGRRARADALGTRPARRGRARADDAAPAHGGAARVVGPGGRQPDRDAARSPPGARARAASRRRSADGRLPAHRHPQAAGRQPDRRDDAVPRPGPDLRARRRHGGRAALLHLDHAEPLSGRHAAPRGPPGRPSGGLRVRPGALGRLHAAGQSGVGGRRARRARARPLGRPVLRREAGRRAARLGRPGQDRDPAGRRAAAPARQPDRADEPRARPAAALLVPAARPRCRGRPDRRRSRQWRHEGPVRDVPGRQPAGLLGRRLGMRARDLVHPSRDADRQRGRRRLPGGRLRDRAAHQHGLQRTSRAAGSAA